jgi:pimeloyl-ACP methyl ester carboxylesterase
MRFPPPLGPRARLVHGLTAAASAPLRGRYGGAVPGRLLHEPGEQRVAVPGGALATLVWGDRAGGGRPTVLVHGINANARYWTGVACMLAGRGGRAVYAPDLRGHGATGRLPGGYELPATRGDLTAWLDGLGLERVELVGHSWGGKVALDLAAARPERVRRLALVDPVPPGGLHPLLARSTAVAAAVFAPERGPFADAAALAAAHELISWLRHAEPWMHRAFDANFRTAPDGVVRHVLSDADFRAIYEGVLPRPSPLPLDGVAMPVLVARASYSVLGLPGQVRRLRRQLPTARVVRVPGEHSLHATNPVGLARVLADFLDEV